MSALLIWEVSTLYRTLFSSAHLTIHYSLFRTPCAVRVCARVCPPLLVLVFPSSTPLSTLSVPAHRIAWVHRLDHVNDHCLCFSLSKSSTCGVKHVQHDEWRSSTAVNVHTIRVFRMVYRLLRLYSWQCTGPFSTYELSSLLLMVVSVIIVTYWRGYFAVKVSDIRVLVYRRTFFRGFLEMKLEI